MSRSHVGLVGLLFVTLFGCAGDNGDDWAEPPTDESADALGTGAALIPGVAAIEFSTMTPHFGNSPSRVERGPIIAAPSKVKKALAAINKRRANQTIPACAGNTKTTRMKFFDASGKELGHGEYSCSVGEIHVAGADTPIFAKAAIIDAVRDLAPLPGDILYGVDRVTIARPGRGPSVSVKDEDAKAIVEAIDLDRLVPIDPSRPVARCLPAAVLTFERDRAEVAFASYMCSNPSGSTSVGATFETSENAPGVAAVGTTRIDPRVVQRILDAR